MESLLQKPDLLSFEGNVTKNRRFYFEFNLETAYLNAYEKLNFRLWLIWQDEAHWKD